MDRVTKSRSGRFKRKADVTRSEQINQIMKTLPILFRLLCSFTLCIYVNTGCKTGPTTEFSQAYKVVGIGGNARYFEEQSETPRNLRVGDRISRGMANPDGERGEQYGHACAGRSQNHAGANRSAPL